MAKNAQGTTVDFTGWDGAIKTVDIGEVKRDALDVSNLASVDAKEFDPAALYDAGEITLNGQYDPAGNGLPPMNGDADELTITFPDGTTLTGDAFVTGFSTKLETNATIEYTLKFKWTGAVTATPATP